MGVGVGKTQVGLYLQVGSRGLGESEWNCREKRLVFVGKEETLAQDCRVKGERYLLVKKQRECMKELMWLGKNHLRSGACGDKVGAAEK